MFALQNRHDGMWWTGHAASGGGILPYFQRNTWELACEQAKLFESREEADAERRQYAQVGGASCQIVQVDD